ncbi:MAG: NfeD family protein [Candidatus Nucleicultricaceae bacterium]
MDGFEFNFWYWWVIGLVLLVLEVLMPGAFFLWMAISAGLTGFLMMLLPGLSLIHALILFAVFSVISVWGWRTFAPTKTKQNDQPLLNERGEQFIGRVVTLSAAIVNGQGKVRLDDTIWKVEGVDCPAHTKVRVIGIHGTVLQVEPVQVD